MKKVVFNSKFDCIICLNGEIPDKNFFLKLQNTPLFAADGAANKLNNIDIIPNKIIGDFDSFDNNFKNISSDLFIKIDEQNTNDFEKILKYACERNLFNCLIIGINGGEFEHSINNWSVFLKYSKRMNLCIYTAERYGFCVFSDISLELNHKEIVSIIPCPSATVTSKNLHWELDKYELEIGKKEGARNVTVAEKVDLILHSGEYCLFVDARLPHCYSFVS